MEEFQKQAEHLLRSEMTKEGVDIRVKENGRHGVDFVAKSPNGMKSEIFLQPMDLVALQSVKIPKEKLVKPKDNLWVALIGFIPNAEPSMFLIPSKNFVNPDNFIFFENNVGQHTHLSNWEIKVFTNGMKKLGEYVFRNQIVHFK